MRSGLLIAAALAAAATVSAEAAELNYSTANDAVFGRLTIEDGLSQSSAQDILLDGAGRLWVGTQDGLDRYNGRGFDHYRSDPADPRSLPDNVVIGLFEDGAGTVWVATMNGGLAAYRPETDDFDSYRSGPGEGSLPSDNVRFMAESADRRLWVATTRGLCSLDPERRAVGRAPGTAGLNIERVLALPGGEIWFTTARGLARLDGRGGFDLFAPPAGALSSEITEAILLEGRRLMVVAGYRDIYVFDADALSFSAYEKRSPALAASTMIERLLHDSRGRLWIGTYDAGLFRDDGPGSALKRFRRDPEDPRSIAGDAIRRIREDRRGQIWIGTYFDGLSVFAYGRQRFHLARSDPDDPSSLLDNVVRGFWRDEESGELWVASSKGVSRWLPSLSGYRRYGAREGNFPAQMAGTVRGLYRAPDGRLFAFSFRGLAVYRPERDLFEEYRPAGRMPAPYDPASALALHVDRAGGEWIGTASGLYLRRRGEGSWTKYTRAEGGLAGDYVTRFFEDSAGAVWIGTSSGLSAARPGASAFENYGRKDGDPSSIGGNVVFSFLEADDCYWLGTHGGGLARLDKASGTTRIYGVKDGLPNDTVYAVLADRSGRLWLSTNRGIARFDPKDGSVATYDEGDGAQSREFNNFAYWQAPDGAIFLGGVAGFNYFDPDEEPPPPPTSSVVLAEARARGVAGNLAWKLASGSRPAIGFANRDLVFTFYSLDFASADGALYRHFLEGYDSGWSEPSRRPDVEYTNLPGRDYALRVMASDAGGGWNARESAYRFRVDPAPWATLPARLAYLALAAAALFGIWRVVARRQAAGRERLERENRRLEAVVAQRTAELRRANEELEALAARDKLTGLYNRRKIDEILASEIARARRYGHRLSIAFADLDLFKAVNDELGHQFGDEVLVRASRALESAIRESDSVGRWGGEEFIVVFPETDLDVAAEIAERLRSSTAAASAELGRAVTLSLGLAELLEGDDEGALVARADARLYEAKAAGRNRVVAADPGAPGPHFSAPKRSS